MADLPKTNVSVGRLVSELTGEILSTENFYSLLPETLEKIAARMGAAAVACCLFQAGRRWEFGWDADTGSPGRLSGVPWISALNGLPQTLVIDPADDTGKRLSQVGLRDGVICTVPLGGEDRLHLLASWSADGDTRKMDTLTSKVAAAAGTLAVGASRHVFQQQALFDPGTGLYNRRYLEAVLPGEVARAKRFKIALSVLLLDVDGFKDINDKRGHIRGDAVLAGLGRVLTRSIRTCDSAIRFGGDEFFVVLPGTPLSGAQVVANRVREGIPLASNNAGLDGEVFTISGGAAAVSHDTQVSELIEAADGLLYQAKERGRNLILFPETAVDELPAPAPWSAPT